MIRGLSIVVMLFAGLSVSGSLSAAPLDTSRAPAAAGRVDRIKVRQLIANLRAVPHGEDLVAGRDADRANHVTIGHLELRSGAQVLVHNDWWRKDPEVVTIHGRIIPTGDDALHYLNGKERREVDRLLRGAFDPWSFYDHSREIRVREVNIDDVRLGLAQLFASTSPLARAYLAGSGIGGSSP